MLRPSVTFYFFYLMLFLMGCQVDDDTPDRIPEQIKQQTTLTVFAAASLTDLFQEIEKLFEAKHPKVDIVLNLAGSQQLASQIQLGAPADVFASADTVKMNQLTRAGFIEQAAVHPFAGNQLVVITPAVNPANLSVFSDLLRPELKLVLAAPEAPAGRYTRLMLEQTSRRPEYGPDFQATVLNRVVSFEQNVRAVRTKVELGEADAGIVYQSDVIHARDNVATLPIPLNINPTAIYPIAPLHNSPNHELACTFIDFVLSEEGQQLLAHHGFVTP